MVEWIGFVFGNIYTRNGLSFKHLNEFGLSLHAVCGKRKHDDNALIKIWRFYQLYTCTVGEKWLLNYSSKSNIHNVRKESYVKENHHISCLLT